MNTPFASRSGLLLLVGILSVTVLASAQTAQENCENRGKIWVNGQCTGSQAQRELCEDAGGTYTPVEPSRPQKDWCSLPATNPPTDTNDPGDTNTDSNPGSSPSARAASVGSGQSNSSASVGKSRDIETESGNRTVLLIWNSSALRSALAQGFQYRMQPSVAENWTEWHSISDERTRRFLVNGLDNGVSHAFEVRSGPHGRTYSISAIPGLPGTPEPPSTASGDASVALHGPSVAGNGSPVETYLYRVGGDGTAEPASTDEWGWQATVSGLTNGNPYGFAAQALNEHGAGHLSAASIAVPSAALPTAPVGLEAQFGTRNWRSLVTLRWNQDLDGTVGITSGGTVFSTGPTVPGVTEYQYRARRFGSSVWVSSRNTLPGGWISVPGGASASSVEILGLLFGNRYEFQVRPIGSDGAGAIATTTGLVHIPSRQYDGPWGFGAEWTHANQAELTWASPPLLLVGRYEYRSSSDYGATWTEWTSAVAECEGVCHTVVSLVAEDVHRYLFQLRQVGLRGIAEAWTGTHPDAPQAPTLADATGSGQGGFSLRWSGAEAGNAATAWEYRRVYLDDGRGSAWTKWTTMQPTSTGDSAFEFTLEPLGADTAPGEYAIQVRGTNAHGAGANSNVVTIAH